MNVYDTANKLAFEIKESNEFLELKKLKEIINSNNELQTKLKEFDTLRYETQIMSMQGKVEEEKTKKMQDIYIELIKDENAKNYLEAEMKFNILISDVNRIIGESIKEIMK